MGKQAKKEHAGRNKDLSEKLLDGKIYYDWVITTSFYSAIHFVDFKLLPLTINGKKCTNINQVRNAYKMPGRHAARDRMVQKELPLLSSKYKWLDDGSRNARYTTYKITPSQAEKAKQYLKIIAEECK